MWIMSFFFNLCYRSYASASLCPIRSKFKSAQAGDRPRVWYQHWDDQDKKNTRVVPRNGTMEFIAYNNTYCMFETANPDGCKDWIPSEDSSDNLPRHLNKQAARHPPHPWELRISTSGYALCKMFQILTCRTLQTEGWSTDSLQPSTKPAVKQINVTLTWKNDDIYQSKRMEDKEPERLPSSTFMWKSCHY